jgi:hypothetical protein
MKVKLIYKNGIQYKEIADCHYNSQRVYLPLYNIPVVRTFEDAFGAPVLQEYVFEHTSFETINGELHKVMQEV